MEQFDINSLINDAISQKEKHHSVYEKILIKVYKKIKISNKRKIYTFVYEVPNYIFGYSLFNTRECIVFLIVALRKKGLYIKYKNPNLLIISWEAVMKNNYAKTAAQYFDKRKNYKSNNFNKSIFQENKKLQNHYNKLNNDLTTNFSVKLDDTLSNASSDVNFHLNKLNSLNEMSKYY